MTDTLALFKRLTAAGMPPVQAELLVEELFEIQKSMPRPQSSPTLPTAH